MIYPLSFMGRQKFLRSQESISVWNLWESPGILQENPRGKGGDRHSGPLNVLPGCAYGYACGFQGYLGRTLVAELMAATWDLWLLLSGPRPHIWSPF